jgi:hypothetical protein
MVATLASAVEQGLCALSIAILRYNLAPFKLDTVSDVLSIFIRF